MKRTRSGTKFRQGDLILLPFPFTDLSAVKRRPALIISPEKLHRQSDDVILVAVTSQVPKALSEFEVPLGSGDMAVGHLPKPSVVRLAKIFTAHRGIIVKRVGRLQRESLARILGRLRALFT
ncbi:MAG: type II toxin-antitoxin system PemK/MazF family toxin [Candidatus Methylomirabilales bacterium]